MGARENERLLIARCVEVASGTGELPRDQREANVFTLAPRDDGVHYIHPTDRFPSQFIGIEESDSHFTQVENRGDLSWAKPISQL